VISFLLGLFRLGFIDVVLSRAVLRGFVTALGAVIIIEQLPPLLGLTVLERAAHPHNNFDKISFLWKHALTSYHRETVIIGLSALFFLLLLRKMKVIAAKKWYPIRQFPEVLFVVILSTYLSAKLSWEARYGIDVLGPVSVQTSPSEFFQSPFRPSNFRFFRQTLSTAILICVVGFLDSIASAKQNAVKFGHSISPNRELVALGVANLAISLIPGTITAFGSTSRSRINGDAGGRTQVSSIVTSTIVLLVTFFMMHLLYHLPKCVLSAIMCLVAFSLLEETPKDLAYYIKLILIQTATAFITLTSCTIGCNPTWMSRS
jgi:MFS superfamily sulfate permease-like transporter